MTTYTVEGLLQKIEDYPFECQGGDLRNCVDWIELKRVATEKLAIGPELLRRIDRRIRSALCHCQPGMECERCLILRELSAAQPSASDPGFCPKCNTRIGVHGGCDCGFCSPSFATRTTDAQRASFDPLQDEPIGQS